MTPEHQDWIEWLIKTHSEWVDAEREAEKARERADLLKHKLMCCGTIPIDVLFSK